MPEAAADSEVLPVNATPMLPSDEFDERELAETSLDFPTMAQHINQEINSMTVTLPDIFAFDPNSGHSALEETAFWDPSSWNIPQNSVTDYMNDILELNEKQTESPSLQRRSSESDLIPSEPAHDVPPSSHNDNSLPGLITYAKQKGWTGALHIAAQEGHEQILRELLQSGNMDVNQQDSDGRTPLLHAVMQNHEHVVRLLLTQGAQIGILDCDKRSGIHWAVLRPNLPILQMLLKHRDEYEPMLAIDSYDISGWTALHMAVIRGFESAMLLLMQLGADINAKAHKCPFQKQ